MTVRSQEGDGAAFDLACLLRDRDFRSFMALNGYVSGTTVVVAHDHEPVIEVFARILNETDPPVVVAVHRPGHEPYGFVFMTIAKREYDAAAKVVEEADDVGDAASIGMLYDTMNAQRRPKAQLTMPHGWSHPATLSVELARAAV